MPLAPVLVRGRLQGQAVEQAKGRELEVHREQATLERRGEGGAAQAARARREGGDLAWGEGHLCPLFSCLVVDPMDAPHPKGWETTLEPYRSMNLKTLD